MAKKKTPTKETLLMQAKSLYTETIEKRRIRLEEERREAELEILEEWKNAIQDEVLNAAIECQRDCNVFVEGAGRLHDGLQTRLLNHPHLKGLDMDFRWDDEEQSIFVSGWAE